MERQSFSIKRCISLLKYDWVLEKNRFFMALGIVLGLWCTLSGMYFMFNYMVYGTLCSPQMSPMSLYFIVVFLFYFAIIAMGIYVTTILHRKFTNPLSSTDYLVLPSQPAEKAVVMLFEYLSVYILFLALNYLCAFVSLSVGNMLVPEIDWYEPLKMTMIGIDRVHEQINLNGLSSELAPYSDQIRSLIDEGFGLMNSYAYFFGYISSLISLLIYICLNMCFRTNAQFKSIGLMILGYIVLHALILYIIIAIGSSYVSDTVVASEFISLVENLLLGSKILVYSTPVILLLLCYLFYRQVRFKMAK